MAKVSKPLAYSMYCTLSYYAWSLLIGVVRYIFRGDRRGEFGKKIFFCFVIFCYFFVVSGFGFFKTLNPNSALAPTGNSTGTNWNFHSSLTNLINEIVKFFCIYGFVTSCSVKRRSRNRSDPVVRLRCVTNKKNPASIPILCFFQRGLHILHANKAHKFVLHWNLYYQ